MNFNYQLNILLYFIFYNFTKRFSYGAGTAFGLPLHSFHFQKIKNFVFLKVTSCIYY